MVYQQQEESVYALLPSKQVFESRPPRHKSKHEGTINPAKYEFGQNTMKGAATMGYQNGQLRPQPDHFLKKHSKEPNLPQPTKPTGTKTKTKPPIPSRHDKPVMGLTSSKNFVTTNAVQNIVSKPPIKVTTDQNATQRKGFGEVPKYLQRNKATIQEEKERVQEYLRIKQDQETNNNISQLEEAERQELLRFLKLKWSEINTAFQKMTFTVDTPAKCKRKETYERQLAEIEKDIRTLEKGQFVVVIDS